MDKFATDSESDKGSHYPNCANDETAVYPNFKHLNLIYWQNVIAIDDFNICDSIERRTMFMNCYFEFFYVMAVF